MVHQLFDGFCHGIGTGGTIAGTGQFMKMMNENVMVVLADPEGSGLYNKVASFFFFLPLSELVLSMRR